MIRFSTRRIAAALLGATGLAALMPAAASAQDIAVRGATLHTSAGAPITDGVVVIRGGKVVAVGPAATTAIPAGMTVLTASVVTPGLVDARSTVGLSGYLNQPHDQDQRDQTASVQPQLRAIDAYNPTERLVEWVRGLGVTTMHTGHGPGALVTGQTMVVKTRGNTVEQALIRPVAMIAGELGPGALEQGGKSPGTRAKQMAMLRAALVKAQSPAKPATPSRGTDAATPPAPELDVEAMREVLARRVALLVTAHHAQDIASAIRLKREFDIDVVVDGGAEAYLMASELKAADVPVILHPGMARHDDELKNASFTTAARLRDAGVRFAFQSGYEAYVPKTRVLLWEAAIAAANGLGREGALSAITIDAARLIGVGDRVGSLEVGKDGDVALFDGDPFEYTSHVTHVVIDGQLVSNQPR